MKPAEYLKEIGTALLVSLLCVGLPLALSVVAYLLVKAMQ